MKRIWIWAAVLLLLAGCSAGADADSRSGSIAGAPAPSSSVPEAESPALREEPKQAAENSRSGEPQKPETTPSESAEPETSAEEAPVLLYMGQATMRVVTPEGKVIYIDPYAGDAYDLPADLILVTHGHFDHCAVEKVENRAPDCRIITHEEAVVDGVHQSFSLPYVTVEAVEAGYNPWHDVNRFAGYVLTFTNGKSVYVTGDTSTTEQMPLLAEKEIDYAFFCCDGIFNMGLEEAARCAEMVGAKHNIPYHNTTDNTGERFDRELAEQFGAPDRLIVFPGEELLVE